MERPGRKFAPMSSRTAPARQPRAPRRAAVYDRARRRWGGMSRSGPWSGGRHGLLGVALRVRGDGGVLFPVRYIIGHDKHHAKRRETAIRSRPRDARNPLQRPRPARWPPRRGGRGERKRADLSGRSRRDRPVAPADREPLAEPEPAPERRDATGATACPDCAGQLAAQLSILPATEHLVRCLDCGAEYVARARPA